MMGVQHRLTKSEMRLVFERVSAYRKAHWPHAPSAVLPSSGSKASSPLIQRPHPDTSGEVSKGLTSWKRNFKRQHGRKPTVEEVSTMMSELYSALGSSDENDADDGVHELV